MAWACECTGPIRFGPRTRDSQLHVSYACLPTTVILYRQKFLLRLTLTCRLFHSFCCSARRISILPALSPFGPSSHSPPAMKEQISNFALISHFAQLIK